MLQYKNIKYLHIRLFVFFILTLGISLLIISLTPSAASAGHVTSSAELKACYDGANSAAQQADCQSHYSQYLEENNSQTCEDGQEGVSIGVGIPGDDNCIEAGTGDENPIFVYLRGIIRFLATGVGIVITISLVVGGIQYMTSRGNPQATQAAINRITNAVIALVLFILMAAILNFLVPGGLL